MTGALHDLWLQLSPPLPSSLASIKPANPSSPGKMAVKTERERGYSFLANYALITTKCWYADDFRLKLCMS